MRNNDGGAIPWGISDFSNPETLNAEAKRLVRDFGNPQPWVPTPERIAKDEQNRIEAREWLARLEAERAAKREARELQETELVGKE